MKPLVASVAVVLALTLAGCDDSSCSEDQPCDENGSPLIFVPYLIPGTGNYIQPGQPGYRPTYQNKPPSYTPPVRVNPPTPGYKPPPAPAVRPPAPAPRPYVPPPRVR